MTSWTAARLKPLPVRRLSLPLVLTVTQVIDAAEIDQRVELQSQDHHAAAIMTSSSSIEIRDLEGQFIAATFDRAQSVRIARSNLIR